MEVVTCTCGKTVIKYPHISEEELPFILEKLKNKGGFRVANFTLNSKEINCILNKVGFFLVLNGRSGIYISSGTGLTPRVMSDYVIEHSLREGTANLGFERYIHNYPDVKEVINELNKFLG